MNARVVSIARQAGCGGEEVARAVAGRLGFRYVDYQIIQRAAEDAAVSPDTVSEAERAPSLMTRILEALARNPSVPVAAWSDPVPLATSPMYTSIDYRKFVEGVITDLASHGDCVIVGHAGQVILRERADTVKVLITGSRTNRVRRLMRGMNVDEKTALRTIDQTDSERLDYYKRFYDSGWLSPCSYDVSISTDHLDPEQAAEVITTVCALR